MRQLQDVSLLLTPDAAGQKQDPTNLRAVWRQAQHAPHFVTQVEDWIGLLVQGSLSLEVALEPRDNPDMPRGWIATLRFRQLYSF